MVLLSNSLSGGQVPSGAVLTRKWIFDKVFDRMDRAGALRLTFSKVAFGHGRRPHNARGDRIRRADEERRASARLQATFERIFGRHELVKEVRGKGLMIGIEFGALKASVEFAGDGEQRIVLPVDLVIPLLKEHRILLQVAGHGNHTIKLLPPLIITDEDCDWIERIFEAVIADAHCVPGAIWSLGTLVEVAGTRPRLGFTVWPPRARSRPVRHRQANVVRIGRRRREAGQHRRVLPMHAQQDAAMLTCFTPSPTNPNHVHFVDGAQGGYALAAAALKQSKA